MYISRFDDLQFDNYIFDKKQNTVCLFTDGLTKISLTGSVRNDGFFLYFFCTSLYYLSRWSVFQRTLFQLQNAGPRWRLGLPKSPLSSFAGAKVRRIFHSRKRFDKKLRNFIELFTHSWYRSKRLARVHLLYLYTDVSALSGRLTGNSSA